MFGFLRVLFSLFDGLARAWRDRQLIDAGKAEGAVEAVKEIEARVEKANDAVRVPDAARTERLRSRFDRAPRSGE